MFIPAKRVAFLIPSGPKHEPDRKHLFIILTNPYQNEDGLLSVLIVSVCSVPENGISFDKACLLFKQDHAFIKHDSYVFYRMASIQTVDGLKNKHFVPQEMVNQQVFDRVCQGLEKSLPPYSNLMKFYQSANCSF